MKKPNEFTINITRQELKWLYQQLNSSLAQARAKLESYVGPQAQDKSKEIQDLTVYTEEISRLTQAVAMRLDEGQKDFHRMIGIKIDLEEAMELNPEAAVAIREQLDKIPKEEPYRITFDQNTARMVMSMLEKDLHNFKHSVIPNYTKKSADEFKDPIMNKTYWLNKAHKAVATLDGLRKAIEQELN